MSGKVSLTVWLHLLYYDQLINQHSAQPRNSQKIGLKNASTSLISFQCSIAHHAYAQVYMQAAVYLNKKKWLQAWTAMKIRLAILFISMFQSRKLDCMHNKLQTYVNFIHLSWFYPYPQFFAEKEEPLPSLTRLLIFIQIISFHLTINSFFNIIKWS